MLPPPARLRRPCLDLRPLAFAALGAFAFACGGDGVAEVEPDCALSSAAEPIPEWCGAFSAPIAAGEGATLEPGFAVTVTVLAEGVVEGEVDGHPYRYPNPVWRLDVEERITLRCEAATLVIVEAL